MPSNINLHIRADGLEKFNRVLKEYGLWSKKQPAEIINAKLFYIARNATNTTRMADKSKIRNELESKAREYDAPLAAVLVNKDLARKGKPGLTGKKMAQAVEKRIRSATSHVNFLRSGWLPAIKLLDYYNKRGDITFVKRWAPKQAPNLKQIGQPKGTAVYAKNTMYRCWGQIENWIGAGKQKSATVTAILQEGLNIAVQLETNSMLLYIQRKYDAKHKQLFEKTF